MIERGVMPKDTKLTPINPLPDDVANPADKVRPWNTLNADEKKLFARMMEVYAGFSEYTDAQVGRLIDYLEKAASSTTPSSSIARTTAHPAKARPMARSTRTSSSTTIPTISPRT
jgi:hypothetical protein